ncbi:hypothetical protein [Flavobacterium sangjuense]|uniref:Uncharacterized protein n=1 Tax=Flavobacterium sangjuense TaxID=2518177 RepID=A0A4P7PW18_9FLAO|nr:hypothetical protein [Flavobacterium sangjuense]QBZ98492.1 hypothetical protein GS03_02000 [Flavobacterium sangjuense]
MDDFLKEMTTVKWWISVALVGILLNVFSSYLKKGIDNFFGKISNRVRQRNAKKEKERSELMEFLKANPSERYMIGIEELRCRIRSVSFLLFSFMMCFFSELFPEFIIQISCLIFAFIILLFGMVEHNTASNKSSILEDLKKK